MCTGHENARFFQITMNRFKIVSDPDIGADVPSMQREDFHRKNHT
jgi:hypothetical protein